MGQVPHQISGNNDVKAAVRKSRMLGIGSLKSTAAAFCCRQRFRLSDHGRCQIDTGDSVAFISQQNGEKTGAAANVKDTQLFCGRQMLHDLALPLAVFFTVQLLTAQCGKSVGPFRPVIFNIVFGIAAWIKRFFR